MATVILIRHAEKLSWKNGLQPTPIEIDNYTDNHLLSAKGYERAHALVGYFTKRTEMQDLFDARPLVCLIAQDVDTVNNWGKSKRPLETIWPLLKYEPEIHDKRIEYPLQCRLFTKSQVNDLVNLINAGEYESKSVVISWCHQQLPDILQGLGITNAPKWPKKRFDVTWVLDTRTKEFKQLPQRLLFGDQDI